MILESRSDCLRVLATRVEHVEFRGVFGIEGLTSTLRV